MSKIVSDLNMLRSTTSSYPLPPLSFQNLELKVVPPPGDLILCCPHHRFEYPSRCQINLKVCKLHKSVRKIFGCPDDLHGNKVFLSNKAHQCSYWKQRGNRIKCNWIHGVYKPYEQCLNPYSWSWLFSVPEEPSTFYKIFC